MADAVVPKKLTTGQKKTKRGELHDVRKAGVLRKTENTRGYYLPARKLVWDGERENLHMPFLRRGELGEGQIMEKI